MKVAQESPRMSVTRTKKMKLPDVLRTEPYTACARMYERFVRIPRVRHRRFFFCVDLDEAWCVVGYERFRARFKKEASEWPPQNLHSDLHPLKRSTCISIQGIYDVYGLEITLSI